MLTATSGKWQQNSGIEMHTEHLVLLGKVNDVQEQDDTALETLLTMERAGMIEAWFHAESGGRAFRKILTERYSLFLDPTHFSDRIKGANIVWYFGGGVIKPPLAHSLSKRVEFLPAVPIHVTGL